jgi:transcriptional regulator GlxA family with amidase domain
MLNSHQCHGFLLLPRFSLLALGGAVDALHAANEVLEERAYSSLTLSLDGQPVRAACGTAVQVAHAISRAPALDAVFVLSDLPLPEAGRDGHAALHTWLRERAAAGVLLGGIGTGAAVLAQAGVLNGHRATLHWAHGPQLADAHAQVVVSSHVYELDRGRLSCTGGSASLDMMMAWLGQRHGERVAQALVAHFGLERLRAPDERQRTPVAARLGLGSAKLTEAVLLMEANLGEPLPTEDIARLVGVSRRQLERLFKQHLDELPSRYYAELRLARARRMLQQTSQSILQVGLGCGFSSGSHFSNAYRAQFGHTPREERSQRAAAWRQQAVGTGLETSPEIAPETAPKIAPESLPKPTPEPSHSALHEA